ncbi:hypothetical protein [Facilibium subflavum]|uniref:hypothetical protein n=1 Tax=Facilibium subflavum TaxID=2219058 RepID=UPI000E6485C7|nr:hypothetical protein [Facilibium subflavum]
MPVYLLHKCKTTPLINFKSLDLLGVVDYCYFEIDPFKQAIFFLKNTNLADKIYNTCCNQPQTFSCTGITTLLSLPTTLIDTEQLLDTGLQDQYSTVCYIHITVDLHIAMLVLQLKDPWQKYYLPDRTYELIESAKICHNITQNQKTAPLPINYNEIILNNTLSIDNVYSSKLKNNVKLSISQLKLSALIINQICVLFEQSALLKLSPRTI